jgi:hypothetical protein
MSKVLRNTLALALLISAVANAPGLLLALGIGDGEGSADVPTGAALAPVGGGDLYYASGPADDADPGAWLDTFLRSTDVPASAWRHSWTDCECPPAQDVLTRYRRSPHWEPPGVMFAYATDYSEVGGSLVSESLAGGDFGKVTTGYVAADFGPGSLRSRGGPAPSKEGEGVQDDTPPPDDNPSDEPGDVPGDQPPPGDDPGPGPGNPPGGDEPDDGPPNNDPPSNPPSPGTNPPPNNDPPVTVPEPASMSLLVLGLAGIFMLGRRRRHALASPRGGRDRG